MRTTARLNSEWRRLSRLRLTDRLATALCAVGLLAAACSGGSSGSSAAGAGQMTEALAYSQCMRDHGISEFPDPNAEGNFATEPGSPLDRALDPDSPRFQEAMGACQSLLPPPPGQQEEEEATQAERLEFARCMRQHAFPEFPDPAMGGGFDLDVNDNPELDPSNPQLQEASEACGGPSEPPDSPPTSEGES